MVTIKIRRSFESEKLIICGDANLCSLKWMDDKYLKKKYAIPIQETLVSFGLINYYYYFKNEA